VTPWRVLVVGKLPEEVRAAFGDAFPVRFIESLASADDAAAQSAEKDAVVVTIDVKMDRAWFGALSRSVKVVATYSVGTEHIDLEAARERGITVLNTPDVLSDSVAEVAIFLMLGAARRATESIALIRSRKWSGWSPVQLNGMELYGKTLGIFGMGRIGRAIAERASAFGMTIHYHNRSRLPQDQEKQAIYFDSLEGLLAASDVVILAAPATSATVGLFDQSKLDLLRPGAMLVNISRGNVVDDEALIAALENGRLSAAGLDVFNREPDLDPRYFDLPNVFMLPHIGSSTREARLRMGRVLIDGLRSLAQGRMPHNRV
jgi:lactate dehydrogenase-like 2-hydroxyacid dehydrogenase